MLDIEILVRPIPREINSYNFSCVLKFSVNFLFFLSLILFYSILFYSILFYSVNKTAISEARLQRPLKATGNRLFNLARSSLSAVTVGFGGASIN